MRYMLLRYAMFRLMFVVAYAIRRRLPFRVTRRVDAPPPAWLFASPLIFMPYALRCYASYAATMPDIFRCRFADDVISPLLP